MTEQRSRSVNEALTARIYRLGEEPSDDLSAITTVAERIEMVALLTRRAWELTGRAWPSLARTDWPVTVIRPQ